MSIVWVCVSELYLYRYTRPSEGKTFLCIYSIYIISVSFAYNMQTATWWSDSTEVQLKGAGHGAGQEAETREWQGGKNQWAGKKERWRGPSSRTSILTSPPSVTSLHRCRPGFHLILRRPPNPIVHQQFITLKQLLQSSCSSFFIYTILCKVPLVFYPAPPPPSQQWIISDYANPSDVVRSEAGDDKKNCIFDAEMPTREWECVQAQIHGQCWVRVHWSRPSVLIWWPRRAGRDTGGRAGPTSTEAAEAAVWGMRNNYLTFRDRRGGFSLELKRSKEQLSCIPAVSYTSLSSMAFRFRVSRKEPVSSLCRALCLVHVCMCIFACMWSIHAEIRTLVDLCSVRSGITWISCTYAP